MCTYYNDEDHETVGVIKFTSVKHPEGVWTSAQNFVETLSTGYSLLLRHLAGAGSFSTSQTHPVFAIVDINLQTLYDTPVELPSGSTTYPGCVVSFDVSMIDVDENIFGVVIDPEATDNWGGPYMDIAGSKLDFRSPPVSGGGIACSQD